MVTKSFPYDLSITELRQVLLSTEVIDLFKIPNLPFTGTRIGIHTIKLNKIDIGNVDLPTIGNYEHKQIFNSQKIGKERYYTVMLRILKDSCQLQLNLKIDQLIRQGILK